jgi:hypothetical protein
MSLNNAFFVSPNLHERKVKLADDSEHLLHFKELPAHEFVRYREQQDSADEEVRVMATPNLIAKSLCNPDGSQALTPEQARKLKTSAASALMVAVLEANTFGAKKNSPSEGDAGSDTSSPSRSAKASEK